MISVMENGSASAGITTKAILGCCFLPMEIALTLVWKPWKP